MNKNKQAEIQKPKAYYSYMNVTQIYFIKYDAISYKSLWLIHEHKVKWKINVSYFKPII